MFCCRHKHPTKVFNQHLNMPKASGTTVQTENKPKPRFIYPGKLNQVWDQIEELLWYGEIQKVYIPSCLCEKNKIKLVCIPARQIPNPWTLIKIDIPWMAGSGKHRPVLTL